MVHVCEVVLGGLMAETDFRAAENSKDSKRCYTEAAEYINTYVQRQPGVRVILSGKDEALAQLRPLLSAPAQQLMIDRVPRNQRDTRDRILRVARAALEHHERVEEHADVDVLLGSAGRGGPAVRGLQGILAAVNAGVVHRAHINRDFRRAGWRCLECNNVGEGRSRQCTVCGSHVQSVELGNAMVSEIFRQDGFVESVVPDDRLRSCDGVGAMLRYKRPVRQSKE
jgi:peptide subunit release factor 1 (eRF1)